MSATDAKWAAMMVPHHRTGIELADLAVRKASTSGVRAIARDAKRDQQAELPRLKVAKAGGRSEEQPERQLRAFDDEQMKRLESLSGKEFDRYWLDVFRSHHMAAIMMTDTASAGTAGGEPKKLQNQVHDDRSSTSER